MKALVLSMSNVLGHVTRAFAIAEALSLQGITPFVAMNERFQPLARVLPKGIRILRNCAFDDYMTSQQGQIDFEALTSSQNGDPFDAIPSVDAQDLKQRGTQFKDMIARDAEIIDQVQPDVIVMDNHYTPLMIDRAKYIPKVFISNYLGFASASYRATGACPYPLDKGPVLAPGIARLECTGARRPDPNWHFLGPFHWDGWGRLQTAAAPAKSDLVLTFGSTGDGTNLEPKFFDVLARLYKVASPIRDGSNAYVGLSRYLHSTKVVLCHGGHGTVYQCIRAKTPMVILPNNVEQLEIGLHIQRLGLGCLIAKPMSETSVEDILAAVSDAMSNEPAKAQFDLYPVAAENGATKAAQFIHQLLNTQKPKQQALCS